MKKTINTNEGVIYPLPQTIITVRGKNGKNNALDVGFCGTVSHDPAMVMIGIEPSRYSRHIVKETGCFVVNFPQKSFSREYGFIGTKSARDVDKFEALNLKWSDGEKVNAPVLTDCPVNLECIVLQSFLPESGSNEIFIGKVEAVHAEEEYISPNGKILWKKIELLTL